MTELCRDRQSRVPTLAIGSRKQPEGFVEATKPCRRWKLLDRPAMPGESLGRLGISKYQRRHYARLPRGSRAGQTGAVIQESLGKLRLQSGSGRRPMRLR